MHRRQKQLDELAERFERKVKLRETWLESNQRLVETENFGSDLPTVEVPYCTVHVGVLVCKFSILYLYR